ncbi:UDP-glucuronosyltransferase 1A1-like isoform X2 [Lissotriton helveticus]
MAAGPLCIPWAGVGLLFVLLSLSCPAEGGKLLVIPQDFSHWLNVRPLVEALRHRGHDIVVVVSETNILVGPSNDYTLKTYSVPYTREQLESNISSMSQPVFSEKTLLEKIQVRNKEAAFWSEMLVSNCRYFLADHKLIQYLRKSQFDVLLIDAVSSCGQIVAEYLSTPSVSYMRAIPCGYHYETVRCPNPISYIPRFFTAYTDHMTFFQRITNLMTSWYISWLCHTIYSRYEDLASQFLQKEMTTQDLLSRTSVWLLGYDFVFEFPQPVMPNMVLIGGITCAERKPLSEEFQKLVDDSGEHGIVVFSLGSMVSEIPMKKAMAIAEALGTVPQTVLWRYTGQAPPNLAANTKLIKWLPQNDLLAHPKARAFITHAGSHGIYEGICNAVPMVLLPLFGDQMDNAKRIESRGAGVTLNVLQMTAQDLSNALKTVINDPSYKENISRLSALHLDRPIHPLDLAVHWVEFVMRHKGAPHLRPAAHDLNWIQYHSLDVIAFLLAVVSVTLFIVIKCCCFCGRKCCGQKRRPQKSKTH